MAIDVSRDVKLALSYIDDAKRQLPAIQNVNDKFNIDQSARELLNGELAKAEQLLLQAKGRGEDINEVYCMLLNIQADIALAAVALWEEAKTHELGSKYWAEWSELSIAKLKVLVNLEPSPSNYLSYGWALYAGDKYQDALTALQMAESGDDENVSLQATKLITEIKEKASLSSNRQKSGCYIATACYGSSDHPDVLVFRRFRDEKMLSSPLGRLFVSVYYFLSPPVASRLSHVRWLSRSIRRWLLEPLARKLR